jgi:hypothetical protein
MRAQLFPNPWAGARSWEVALDRDGVYLRIGDRRGWQGGFIRGAGFWSARFAHAPVFTTDPAEFDPYDDGPEDVAVEAAIEARVHELFTPAELADLTRGE